MLLALDGWRIDPASRTATRQDRTVQLSPRAVRLVQVMAEAGGAVLTRGALLDRVWPHVTVSDESLTQVVSEVRRKLGNRDLIVTVARGGYRLGVPVLRKTAAGPPMAAAPEGRGPGAPPLRAGLVLDAYALCLEARDCFATAAEGVHRSFVDLTAEAARLAPGFAEARALHATALFKRHIYLSEGAMLLEETLTETEAALALDPTHAGAHLIEGAARMAIGQAGPGLRAVETALALGRTDAALHLDAAILLLSAGQVRAAAALALHAAHLAPDQFAADLLLARVLLASDPVKARRHAERALRKVQEALTLDPHSMRALYALGPLLAQLGDARAARAALDGVGHHESPLEYYRALGFAQLGDGSAALERLDFLAQRGWRHACILDKDPGFWPLRGERRLERLQAEIMAA